MDLHSLSTFIQVAESKNFTRAGRQLGYSQPTVSFQIKQLEQELGVRLFDRIGHTVSLTSDGRELLSYAQGICRMSQEMLAHVKNRERPRGLVRLAMADSLCAPLLAGGFARFREKYPDISLKIMTAGTSELFRLLDQSEADLVCTLDSHIYSPDYVIAAEEKVGVHFVCPVGHPLAKAERPELSQILAQPFLLTEKGMSYRRLLDEKLAERSLSLSAVLELGSADLICSMVSDGLGLSFLPDYVTEQAVKEGSIVRLETAELDIELWKQTLYRRDKWLGSHIRAVLDYLSGMKLSE